MSTAITFTPGHLHLTQSAVLDKSYMDFEVSIDGKYRGSVGGYVAKQVIDLIAVSPELLEALRELLAAELAMCPAFEAGKEAQDAWADRRAAARNNASFVIDKATGAA